MVICDLSNCTGCFACKSICPNDAIEVIEDELGRTIPSIYQDKCIECGLCNKICPVNNDLSFEYPKSCYAVWTKSEEDRKLCSSGGVSTGIAKYIIDNGGIVFGAAYNEESNLVMKQATTYSELDQFRGSKYVHCSTEDSYVKAKEHLLNGREVLYVGMPCQISGLLNFLQKKYDNLYTIDIICHGTPPIKYLREYCKETFKDKKVTKVLFRGENDFCLTIYEKEELIYLKPSYKELFFLSFLKNLIFRENCYKCKYAQENRIADITIGDFWGLDRTTMKKSYNGRISVALVNTDQGELLFTKVKENFNYEERSIQEAVNGNSQLRQPSNPHKDREKFVKYYKKEGILNALNSTDIKKNIMISKIKDIKLYKILRNIIKGIIK